MQPLRPWLKQAPQPYKLIADFEDGTTKTIKVGEARSKYRDAELSLKGAIRIEAMDREGDVLRVWEAHDAVEREAAATARRGDDSMAMVTRVAQLLVEAGDHAAERHAQAYQLAYQQQMLLVSTVTERLASLERVWHEQLMNRADDIAEQENELAEAIDAAAATGNGKADDPNTGLVMGLLQGVLMNGGAPPSAGKGGGSS